MLRKAICILPLIGAVMTFTGAASAGPVAILGIDAESGGVNDHGPTTAWAGLVDNVLAQVTNGGSGILVIGGGKGGADDVTPFWDFISADIGVPVTYVNGAGNIAAQSFAGFALLAVAGSVHETPDGGLTEAENDALVARRAEIAAFVNAGGGLFSFAQSDLAQAYGFLAGFGNFNVALDIEYKNIEPTAVGLALGLTEAVDLSGTNENWHDIFLTFPSFLQPLALVDEPSHPHFGEAAALGGATVTITGVDASAKIPTLTEWALILLGLILLVVAALFLRAGRQTPKAPKS